MAFIESLESRRLFAVSAGMAALRTMKEAEPVLATDIRLLRHDLVADRAVIIKDLQRLGTLRADASEGAAADSAALSLVRTLQADRVSYLAKVNKDATDLVIYETLYAKHPTTALENKITAVDAAFNTDANDMVSQFTTDSDTTTLDNALAAIASANSGDTQTGTDVLTAENDASNNLTTLNNDVNTLINTDAQALQNVYFM